MFPYGIITIFLLADRSSATPWIPERHDENPSWNEMHQNLKDNSATYGNMINIIFYGDSMTAGWWASAWDIFTDKYASLGGVNYGISEDRTEHVLYRILNGEMEGVYPKLIVLLISVNNWYHNDSAEDTTRGVQEIIQAVHEKSVKTKILLLGPPPCCDWFAEDFCDLNIRYSKLQDYDKIHFLSFLHEFASSWNKINRTLYSEDMVHLERPGYELWAQLMALKFSQLLNEVRGK